MSGQRYKFRVTLKYCGSCNPHVDLPRIARKLIEIAEKRQEIILLPFSEEHVDAVVILCGCPRACGNKDEVRNKARLSLVIAGESLDSVPIPEERLVMALEEKLTAAIDRK